MSKGKMRGAFLLALLVLVAVPLAGCQFGESFPFYLMEERKDGSEVLYMDGVQYVRKQEWNENANYYNGGYCWTPADGIGEQIGVCGKDADEEASLKIYEVAGDEEHIFLYCDCSKYTVCEHMNRLVNLGYVQSVYSPGTDDILYCGLITPPQEE